MTENTALFESVRPDPAVNRLPPAGATVVVAMSGGVDSSVAAALMKVWGYNVIGVSMLVDEQTAQCIGRKASCCTLDDFRDAKKVAREFGFPHTLVDFVDEFGAAVIDPFVAAYQAGETPTPCTECNKSVKFDLPLKFARDAGAGWIATGHYARLPESAPGRVSLATAYDDSRDQTYFMWPMAQPQLARAVFPVGHLQKPEVRALARALGLSVAEKPESREICFVKGGRYADYIEQRVGPQPHGEIVHSDGRVLATHEGIHRYTVGQRHGLGLAWPAPLYVVGIDAKNRQVVVDEGQGLFRDTVVARAPNYPEGGAVTVGQKLAFRVRYRSFPMPATVVDVTADAVAVRFDEPVRAVTPGQGLVGYDGDRVAVGAIIRETSLSDAGRAKLAVVAATPPVSEPLRVAA